MVASVRCLCGGRFVGLSECRKRVIITSLWYLPGADADDVAEVGDQLSIAARE